MNRIRSNSAYYATVNRNSAPQRLTQSGAYAYWQRARDFEQIAIARKDWAMAQYQQKIRVTYENRLLELDATCGGNI
jgi:hypothetical protein